MGGNVWERLKSCYPPIIELIPVGLIGWGIYVLVSGLEEMALLMPVDFSFFGKPTVLATKNPLILWSYISLAAALYAIFSLISYYVLLPDDPRELIKLPADRATPLDFQEAQAIQRSWVRSFYALKTLTVTNLIYRLWGTVWISLTKWDSLGLWPWLTVILMVLVVLRPLYLLTKTISAHLVRASVGETSTSSEDKNRDLGT
ncbi:MAG: hypothetical protein H5U02_09065 [Clostridia bacterium]|nr:hypothetical protein [Clostridia bacterium]